VCRTGLNIHNPLFSHPPSCRRWQSLTGLAWQARGGSLFLPFRLTAFFGLNNAAECVDNRHNNEHQYLRPAAILEIRPSSAADYLCHKVIHLSFTHLFALLKGPDVISTEATQSVAKWRNLLKEQISRLACGSLEMTTSNVFNRELEFLSAVIYFQTGLG
jgi:hypothetical protein